MTHRKYPAGPPRLIRYITVRAEPGFVVYDESDQSTDEPLTPLGPVVAWLIDNRHPADAPSDSEHGVVYLHGGDGALRSIFLGGPIYVTQEG